MPATYPKRPQLFTLRFIRVVTRSCAAQEIGGDGVALLITIACVEDSKRYTGAVTLKFLNGEPQEAEFGRPHVVVFAKPGPAVDKPLDSARPPAPSSTA